MHTNTKGGRVARRNSWPWVVRLKVVVGGILGDFDCGGTIIDDGTIVTAAHCVKGATEVRAFISDHDANQQDATERIVKASDQNITIHPDYQALSGNTSSKFDIAVVNFDEKLVDGKLADRACLPSQLDLKLDGAKCWTAGWGNRPGWGSELNEARKNLKKSTKLQFRSILI